MREEEEKHAFYLGGAKVRASFVLNRVFSPNILVYTFFFFYLSNLKHFFLPFSTSFLYEMYFTRLCQVPYEISLMNEVQRAFKIPLFCTIWGSLINLFLSLSPSSGLCCEDRAERTKIMGEGRKGMTNRRKVLLA